MENTVDISYEICEKKKLNFDDKLYNYVDELEARNKIIALELYDFKYKIEELRVSFFAQELKTLYPVSSKRLLNELEQLYLQNLT